jgi:hypothetical protein
LFHRPPGRADRNGVAWERSAGLRSFPPRLIPPFPGWIPMTAAEFLQFEIIRAIAASLISVAIVLLWLVAISRP